MKVWPLIAVTLGALGIFTAALAWQMPWREYPGLEAMQRVFPDQEIVDIPDKDAIFHTIYDLDGRYQVPGPHLRVRRLRSSLARNL